ncbi:non-hydrolyzing UDP-N-acetylglucosamine 2-epimerase [Pelagibius sp. Alg239-R121]|uniref:non-hydrolyzing UDP-N-acetylglucosamine 2-epimerase n=1 Tax=Pelagibius sp. Alg239-R121 TaxID=2993448 RepID=UPI0024A6868B|nr:UDP-N-acetylglucosamine 2-epimerase (non-hydrolyzing) [Pelagibius sp. Alg239-R121]
MTKVFSASGDRIMIIAGTRPELIKVAPVACQLGRYDEVRVTIVSTAQQADLLPAFLGLLDTEVDYHLGVMSAGQSLNALLSKTIAALDLVIAEVQPNLIVVQGDTTSALAGALAGRMRAIPVAHIEAGLRTGDPANPFPEETNRRLISHVASLHCAPTRRNRAELVREGIAPQDIIVTGNPVVSSLQNAIQKSQSSPDLDVLLENLKGLKPVVLTTHRRESFGTTLDRNLRTLRAFIMERPDTALVVPVHPNPMVKETVQRILSDSERVSLIEPLDYPSFVRLLQAAWLIVSDSGGVQEEVASLGKPLLVLRSVTERPEAIDAGVAKLAGEGPGQLEELLGDCDALNKWIASIKPIANPFGDAQSSARIAQAFVDFLTGQVQQTRAVQ